MFFAKPTKTDNTRKSKQEKNMPWSEIPMRPTELLEEKPKLLLVDDDPTYGKIMMRIAEKLGIEMTFCSSVQEVGDLSGWNFDVAVIDCDLGSVTGHELTTYIEHHTNSMPVILVSQSQEFGKVKRPATVRQFLCKGLGPHAVFDAAFDTHNRKKMTPDTHGSKRFFN